VNVAIANERPLVLRHLIAEEDSDAARSPAAARALSLVLMKADQPKRTYPPLYWLSDTSLRRLVAFECAEARRMCEELGLT